MDYDNVLLQLDLDTKICPRSVTADRILRYVRATENASGSSSMQRLYNVIEDKVEAAEFVIKENAPFIGKPLSKLKLKKNVLIAAITRGDEVIVPRGNDTIEVGDTVIVISKKKALADFADALR